MMGGERCKEGKEQLLIQSTTSCINDDVTADRSIRMNSEVYRDTLHSQIYPNATKLIGWRFTLQLDNDPKHTRKENQESKEMQWESQSPEFNPIQQLLKTTLEAERPTNKQQVKMAAVKACKASPGRKLRVCSFPDSLCVQRIFIQELKVSSNLMLVCPDTSSDPLKTEVFCIKCL